MNEWLSLGGSEEGSSRGGLLGCGGCSTSGWVQMLFTPVYLLGICNLCGFPAYAVYLHKKVFKISDKTREASLASVGLDWSRRPGRKNQGCSPGGQG